MDSAKELLKLNSQIKGGVINIFPLSLIEEHEEKLRKYPEPTVAVPLMNHISLKLNADPRLSKLVNQFFSKVVLVKNYQLAMDIAKEYNLTCITPDL